MIKYDADGSQGWAKNYLARAKKAQGSSIAPEISRTSSPVQREDHERDRPGLPGPLQDRNRLPLDQDPAFIRWLPMYHWTDSKIRVHGLTCVMALLYLSLLQMKLKSAGLDLSLDRAMQILRGIRLAICFYPCAAQPVRKICRLGSTE
ncbi:MAG: hypothetical protein WCC06_11740 [Candidatus Aminicenantales bacterium]